MTTTHATATHPMKRLYFPKLKGPGTNVFLAIVMRKNIGSAYEMYKPIVAIDTMA
jgi:hypothetical protein